MRFSLGRFVRAFEPHAGGRAQEACDVVIEPEEIPLPDGVVSYTASPRMKPKIEHGHPRLIGRDVLALYECDAFGHVVPSCESSGSGIFIADLEAE